MSELVNEISNHNYVNELEITNVEIIVRIMSIIGLKGSMSGKERKRLAIRVITNLIEDEIIRKEFIKLIDTIYDLHKGRLWNEPIKKVDISNIDNHIRNRFTFIGNVDHNDIFRIITYVINLMDQYTELTPSQRRENVINIVYEFIKSQAELLTRERVKRFVDLVIKIKDGKFTINVSKIKRFVMKFCKCKL